MRNYNTRVFVGSPAGLLAIAAQLQADQRAAGMSPERLEQIRVAELGDRTAASTEELDQQGREPSEPIFDVKVNEHLHISPQVVCSFVADAVCIGFDCDQDGPVMLRMNRAGLIRLAHKLVETAEGMDAYYDTPLYDIKQDRYFKPERDGTFTPCLSPDRRAATIAKMKALPIELQRQMVRAVTGQAGEIASPIDGKKGETTDAQSDPPWADRGIPWYDRGGNEVSLDMTKREITQTTHAREPDNGCPCPACTQRRTMANNAQRRLIAARQRVGDGPARL